MSHDNYLVSDYRYSYIHKEVTEKLDSENWYIITTWKLYDLYVSVI